MSELFIEDYIKKITQLEKQIGAKTRYQIIEPFSINSRDILAIQEAAKKIAEFVGLHGLTFIIATVKQKEKVGGNVELKYGEKEVFVEVSDDILKFEDAVLATLAHEIIHKYLHINSISCGMGPIHEYENEVITDITAVFLGLGKLMLNGCECQNVRQEYVPEGTKTITETLKSGYLDREQLAFVYRLVCVMRGISNRDMLSNLSMEAISAIKDCDCYSRNYFDPRFSTQEFRDKLAQILMEDVTNLQGKLNETNQLLQFLKEKCIRETEEFLEVKHKTILSLRNDLESMKKNDIYDPCLRFLETIQLKEWINQIKVRVSEDIFSTTQVRQKLYKLQKIVPKEGLPKLKTKPFWGRIISHVFKL